MATVNLPGHVRLDGVPAGSILEFEPSPFNQFKAIQTNLCVYIYTNLNHPIFKGVDREGRIDFFKAEESRPSPPCGDSGYPMIAGALTSSGNHGARTRRSETSPGGGANDKAPSHHLAGSRGQKEIIPASKLLEVE